MKSRPTPVERTLLIVRYARRHARAKVCVARPRRVQRQRNNLSIQPQKEGKWPSKAQGKTWGRQGNGVGKGVGKRQCQSCLSPPALSHPTHHPPVPTSTTCLHLPKKQQEWREGEGHRQEGYGREGIHEGVGRHIHVQYRQNEAGRRMNRHQTWWGRGGKLEGAGSSLTRPESMVGRRLNRRVACRKVTHE